MTARGPRSGRGGTSGAEPELEGPRVPGVPGLRGRATPRGDSEDGEHRSLRRRWGGGAGGPAGCGAGGLPPELARIVLGQDLPRTRCFVLGLAAPAAAPARGLAGRGTRGGPRRQGRAGGYHDGPGGARGPRRRAGGSGGCGGRRGWGGPWHRDRAGGLEGGSWHQDGAGGAGGHRSGGRGHRAGAAPAPGLCPQEQSTMAWGRGPRATVPKGDTAIPTRHRPSLPRGPAGAGPGGTGCAESGGCGPGVPAASPGGGRVSLTSAPRSPPAPGRAPAAPRSHSDGTRRTRGRSRCDATATSSRGGEEGRGGGIRSGEGARASPGLYMMLHFPLILSVLFCLLERFPSMVRLTFLLFSRFSSSWKSSLTL